jgi:peptidoglycan/xylan/chitin deacetylase (PgdA/CDA1 family)
MRSLKLGSSLLISALPVLLAIIYFADPSFYAIVIDRFITHSTEAQLRKVDVSSYAPINRSRQGIPVLVYHQISERPGEYCVTKRQFLEHLKLLKHLGYTTVSIDELDRYLNHGGKLPKNPMLITFDDGERNAYIGADEALHLLGMKATMFVITSLPKQESSRSLNWRELRQMRRSGRWDIQSHTYDGHSLNDAKVERMYLKRLLIHDSTSVKDLYNNLKSSYGSLN